MACDILSTFLFVFDFGEITWLYSGLDWTHDGTQESLMLGSRDHNVVLGVQLGSATCMQVPDLMYYCSSPYSSHLLHSCFGGESV